MTIYHRYIIADARSTTLAELRDHVRELDERIDFDHEMVIRDGNDCGILIDVTMRGNPVFDDDLVLVRDRLRSGGPIGHRSQAILNTAQCMVTTQVFHNANPAVLYAIWSALKSYRPGILVMEDYASTIRYYE